MKKWMKIAGGSVGAVTLGLAVLTWQTVNSEAAALAAQIEAELAVEAADKPEQLPDGVLAELCDQMRRTGAVIMMVRQGSKKTLSQALVGNRESALTAYLYQTAWSYPKVRTTQEREQIKQRYLEEVEMGCVRMFGSVQD